MEVIVCTGTQLSSYLTKWFTGSPYTHSALRYDENDGLWMIHSTIGGVQPEWWPSFAKHYLNITRFRCKFAVAEEAADWLAQEIGHRQYDYLGFVGMGIFIIAKKLGIPLKRNPLAIAKWYHCSEMVFRWMQMCNTLDPDLRLPKLDLELVTPEDLFRIFKARDDLFELVT